LAFFRRGVITAGYYVPLPIQKPIEVEKIKIFCYNNYRKKVNIPPKP
jgi:hypothetical protein